MTPADMVAEVVSMPMITAGHDRQRCTWVEGGVMRHLEAAAGEGAHEHHLLGALRNVDEAAASGAAAATEVADVNISRRIHLCNL